MRRYALCFFVCTCLIVVSGGEIRAAESPRDQYMTALARERTLRAAAGRQAPPLDELRALIRVYDRIVRLSPRSGYSDNALWQAAGLALEAFERYGQEQDRRAGQQLLQRLAREYPSSSLVRHIQERLVSFDTTAAVPRTRNDPATTPPRAGKPVAPTGLAEPPLPAEASRPAGRVLIRAIRRVRLPTSVRITVELDAEVPYREQHLSNPERVFFDLQGTQVPSHLMDAQLTFPDDDVARDIRLGRHPDGTTRIVLGLEGVQRYSAFILQKPYRLVLNFERQAPPAAAREPSPAQPASVAAPASNRATTSDTSLPVGRPAPSVIPASPSTTGPLPVPQLPAPSSSRKFSLARQLGLGVARVVIDPGHGGHDPGARTGSLAEAELVLDVALRLEQLLLKEPGIEVVLTRRTDVFVPLEERTALANTESADLFLSIHANASTNRRARGVETYFLNFATSPDAEAVAARENATSGRTMRNLPDIVRAIALNNKLEESRDLATTVQQALVRSLRPLNPGLKSLGVRQAPFVVLIGAEMPSVLAEISFITNRAEGRLLRTSKYRQRITEALRDAVLTYQRSLKRIPAVAQQR